MSEKWFYKVGEQEIGPLTAQQLKQLAEENRLAPTDPIRRENDTTWHLASQVKGLFTAKAAEKTEGLKRSEPAPAAAKPAETPKPAPVPEKGTKKIRVARAIMDEPAPSQAAPVKVSDSASIPRGIPVGTVPQGAPPQNTDFAAFAFDTAPTEPGKRQPAGRPRAAAAGDDTAMDPAAMKKQKQQQQFYIMAGAAGGLAVLGIILIFILNRGPAEEPQESGDESVAAVVDDSQARETESAEKASSLKGMDEISKTYAIPGMKTQGAADPDEAAPANETGESLFAVGSAKTAEDLEAEAKHAGYRDATRTSVTVAGYNYKLTDIRYDTKGGASYLRAMLEIRHENAFQQQGAMKNWDAHLQRVTCTGSMAPGAKSLVLEKNIRSEAIQDNYKDTVGIKYPLAFRAPDGLPKIVFITVPDFVLKDKEYKFFVPQRAWGVSDVSLPEDGLKPAPAEEGAGEEAEDEWAEDEEEELPAEEPKPTAAEDKYGVNDESISAAERERRQLMADLDDGSEDEPDDSPWPEAPEE